MNKIAFTTAGNDLNGQLDKRFGRAPKFIIYDLDSNIYEVVDNMQNLNAAQGAGIQSAQTVAKTGAKAVVTGNCGPKAFRVLRSAGIRIFNTDIPTVRGALQAYLEGKLTEIDSANVEGHWA